MQKVRKHLAATRVKTLTVPTNPEALRDIVEAVNLEHSVAVTSWTACFENNKQCFRYRTLCAIGVNFFQQATGINIATYYAGES